ncbi:hypothetical protein [Zarconia navalis]|nr:hypothetical protein [Zarconia navalis]
MRTINLLIRKTEFEGSVDSYTQSISRAIELSLNTEDLLTG